MSQFCDSTIAIDRICIQNFQICAYPNKLVFGECLVLSNLQTILPVDNSFTILNVDLDKFLTTLVYFSEVAEINEEITVTFQYTDSTIKLSSSEQCNYLSLISNSNREYRFKNDQDFKSLVSAVIDLSILTYCYTGVVNYNLNKFLIESDLLDYDNLTEDTVFAILNKIKPFNQDYYVFLPLVERHKIELYRLKKLYLFVQNKD